MKNKVFNPSRGKFKYTKIKNYKNNKLTQKNTPKKSKVLKCFTGFCMTPYKAMHFCNRDMKTFLQGSIFY